VVFLLSAETIDTATWPRARHKPQQILQKPFPLKQMGRMLEAAGLATAAAPDASAYPLLTETAPKHAAAERLPVYGPSAAGGDDAILPAWPEPTSLTERLRLDDTVLDQLRALLPLLEHALRRAGDGVAPLPWAEGLQQLRRYFQAADAQALILTLDHQAHLLRQAQHQGEHAPFEALARYLARWQALLNQAP
jgi:hypothetical protein